jgi:hypothetical protein
MRSTIVAVSGLVLFVVCDGCSSTKVQASELVRAPFDRSLAQDKWREYLTRVRNIQATMTERVVRPKSPAEPGWEKQIEIRHTDDCALVISQPVPDGKEPHHASVVGRTYSFVLTRKTAGRPWILTEFSPGKAADSDEPLSWVNELMYGPLTVLSPRERLLELVRNPDFKIVGSREVGAGGDRLVRIDFTNTPKYIATRDTVDGMVLFPGRVTLKDGYVLLDPSRYWLIREFLVTAHDGPDLSVKDPNLLVTMSGKYDYKALRDGTPVLSKVVWQCEQAASAAAVGNRHELDYAITDNLPSESDFTLTAFGLPEPAGEKRPTTARWFLWATVAGVVCMALAIAFRRLASRKPA